MADSKELLKTLLEALQDKSDETEDKDLKTLFKEVRDELRIANGNTVEAREAREREREVEELARTSYPALRSRFSTDPRHVETPHG